MIYKVNKLIFADMEREEAWLNEMAEQGYNFLDNVFIRYTFTEGEPNEYIYRIQLMENGINHPLSRQYIKFLKETGVEFVSSSGRWAYFRKKAADGPFDLYSDIDAKIAHYKKIISYVSTILFFNIMVFILNTVILILKRLPANFSIALSVLFFAGLLIKSLFHYRRKIKELKEDQDIHE